jgi:hypothetical protein
MTRVTDKAGRYIGPLPEGDEVLDWRATVLTRAGYPKCDAIALAESTSDVDLHEAVGLLARGCPVKQALDILL